MLRLVAHPALHAVFETLGYALGYAMYKRARQRGDVIGEQQRWTVIAAAMVGALVGSRALGLLEQMPRIHIGWTQIFLPEGGKTIVGGLLGGWIAVEAIKKVQGIRTRTGDLFAVPLCLGIGIGRIGCFLAGFADDTYGTPTSLPWAVNLGDGIGRHPVQLYEVAFLTALGLVLARIGRRPHPNGILFRLFLGSYLTWRLLIDFLKPQPLVAGMNMIQWACVAGLCLLAADAWRSRQANDVRHTIKEEYA